MPKELEIKFGIGDWHEEYSQAEIDISDADKLATEATHYTAAQLARMAVVAHQLRHAKKRYLPENKPLFATGAHLHTAQLLANRERAVTLENGRDITIREFVGPVRGDDDHDCDDTQDARVTPPEPFVNAVSEMGLMRATDYLRKRVPGYVKGRLKLIAANGGDVRAEAEILKALIDAMVEELG